jgi:hypothetical protein
MDCIYNGGSDVPVSVCVSPLYNVHKQQSHLTTYYSECIPYLSNTWPYLLMSVLAFEQL